MRERRNQSNWENKDRNERERIKMMVIEINKKRVKIERKWGKKTEKEGDKWTKLEKNEPERKKKLYSKKNELE